MHAVAITPIYAGLLGLLLVALSWRVARLRLAHKVGIGDGGVPPLSKAVRVHGNFTEHVPLALLLVLMVELTGGPAWLVHGLGAALFLGRLAHAQGLTGSTGKSPGRMTGVLLTWTVLVAASVALVVGALA